MGRHVQLIFPGGRRPLAPRPGQIIVGSGNGAGRVEIERILGRRGAGWEVLGPHAELLVLSASRTPGVWLCGGIKA